MYTIYTIPGSCSSGITTLCEQLGVEYTTIKRDSVEDYASIVPTQQVPALKKENGEIITEGAAIVMYLLEKYGPSQIPSDPHDRSRFYQQLMYNYATLHPAYSKVFTIAAKIDMEETQRKVVLDQLAKQVSGLWAIVDKKLEDKKFFLGETPSIVDYLLAIYSSWNNYFPTLDIPLGENLKSYVGRVSDLPEFKRAYAKESIEFAPAA